MARVYLETSFVSACVTDRKDAGSVYRREKSLEWWALQAQRHELCTSGEVILELSDPRYRRRDEAIQFVHGIPLLPVNQQVLDLAGIVHHRKSDAWTIEGRRGSCRDSGDCRHRICVELERPAPC